VGIGGTQVTTHVMTLINMPDAILTSMPTLALISTSTATLIGIGAMTPNQYE